MFDENSFVPATKLVGDKSYSILTDHLGTLYEAYDEEGKKVWSAEYEKSGIKDIWGTDYRSHHVSYDPETNKMIIQLVYTSEHKAKLPHERAVKQFEIETGVEYDTKAAKDKAKELNEKYH